MGQKPKVKTRVTFKYGRIPKAWHHCFICETFRDLTVHHIKPKCEGGTNYLFNLMVLCDKHHKMIEGQGSYANSKPKWIITKYNKELDKRKLKQWKI